MFASLYLKYKDALKKCFFRIERGLAAKTIALMTSKTKHLSVGNRITISYTQVFCFAGLLSTLAKGAPHPPPPPPPPPRLQESKNEESSLSPFFLCREEGAATRRLYLHIICGFLFVSFSRQQKGLYHIFGQAFVARMPKKRQISHFFTSALYLDEYVLI